MSDGVTSKIIELEGRLQAMEQSFDRLVDNVLKLEQLLTSMSDVILPPEDEKK